MAESPVRNRRLNDRLLTLLLLAGTAALDVASAQAACGDYVHVNGLAANYLPHLPIVPVGQGHAALPRSPIVPCSGPNCGRLPEPTPAAPAVPQGSLAKCWAARSRRHVGLNPAFLVWLRNSPDIHPFHHSSPPDRPPRPVQS